MSSDVLVKVEGVSKKFSSKLKTSMKYGIIDIAKDFIGLPSHSDTLRPDEFWGVQDVSFEVRRGECLGLIGVNGAGKSTLLKILNGIIMPDKGSVEINGRVSALIEVGAGFHPLLTGRENIYINGSIMGLKKKEIDKKFDSIVEFAELGDFIETPVSYYSSGMFVRLGFAIAAHLKPDVLLIDEVLAVGDMGFKIKCLNEMAKLLNNSAVVFISHSMLHVSLIAKKIIVLHQGKVNYFSNYVGNGIDYYISQFQMPEGKISRYGETEIKEIRISNGKKFSTGNSVLNVDFGDDLIVEITVNLEASVNKVGFSIILKDSEHRSVAHCPSELCGFKLLGKSKKKITVRIPQLRLNSGIYSIIISIDDLNKKKTMLRYDHAAYVQFPTTYSSVSPFLLEGKWFQEDID